MTLKEETFQTLSDLEWHCSHEFRSSQAARIIKDLRNEGYSFWVNESKTRWAKSMYCDDCKRNTQHRKMLSLKKEFSEIKRMSFSNNFRKRVLELYDNKDTLTRSTDRLEVDHRITPERTGGEKTFDENEITDEEIKQRYMVLSRVNNQIKREACKKCITTNKKQPSLTGVKFFYKGNENYNNTCEGCFWAYPEKWRSKLNELYRK